MQVENRSSIISVITTPLGFFALALLILEGFLAISLIGSGDFYLEESTKVLAMWMATGSFAGIITIVSLFAAFNTKALMINSQAWADMEIMNRQLSGVKEKVQKKTSMFSGSDLTSNVANVENSSMKGKK